MLKVAGFFSRTWAPTGSVSVFTVHGSRFTVHGSRFTVKKLVPKLPTVNCQLSTPCKLWFVI